MKEYKTLRFVSNSKSDFYEMQDYLKEHCRVVHMGGYYSVQVDEGSPDNEWYFHFSNSTLYLENLASSPSKIYFGAIVGENENKSKLENFIRDFCGKFPDLRREKKMK